ncbi:Adaptive-response sensory-kinase SasA [subsurface metagenome]
MKDADKTKEQLITELVKLRRRVRELETSDTERKQADEALKAERNKLEAITEAMEWGLTIQDLDYNIIYQNEVLKNIFGDRLGEKCYNVYEGKDKLCDRCPVEMAFRDGKSHTSERKIIMPSGEPGVWENTANPVRNARGEVVSCLEIARNITERKQAEEALRKSEECLRTVVSNSPVVIWALDREGKFTLSEGAGLEALGLKPGEVVGQSVYDVYRDVPIILENNCRALAGETFVSIVETQDLVFESHYSPIRDENQEIIGMVGVSTDITERKRAEEALLESEERYRALVNLGGAVGEAIVMLQDTEQGNAIQTFVSKEWPRITGYSKKELLDMSFFDLLHPKYHEASLKRHKRRMRGEAIPKLFELSIIRKDGTEVPIEVTSAYSTHKGERANVAFIRDITERKQAEERERQLQQELHLSSRLAAIGQLAAGVAHEINNPLTGMLGYSELLLRKPTDENTKKGLEIIHSSSLRVAKIVQNLLTFARHRQPKKEYVDINEIVKEALELRAYELKTSNIEVALDLAPDLPQIMGDFHQIQEVFLNLILNAEQAMTEAHRGGKLIIKTKQLKGRVRVSFTDDGPGIPAEHLNKLFDPFFSTRGEKGGTGLGLSICHGIVEEHRGRIYAKSKMGEGATLFVELPVTT